mmetsp:Transcript_45727/g.118197  ORF Transcript_45727/g.118197 Transcript_45727/m.118197 type:complete len:144 (-) Transcript_45727:130-561(-)
MKKQGKPSRLEAIAADNPAQEEDVKVFEKALRRQYEMLTTFRRNNLIFLFLLFLLDSYAIFHMSTGISYMLEVNAFGKLIYLLPTLAALCATIFYFQQGLFRETVEHTFSYHRRLNEGLSNIGLFYVRDSEQLYSIQDTTKES